MWYLVLKPADRTIIGTRWDESGAITRNKSCLVVQGYNKEEGIDYDEIFALVYRMEAIGVLIEFAAFIGFKLFQVDVKGIFLNADLKKKYMLNDHLNLDANFANHVFKLNKALYGLKQAPKAWYERLLKFN